MRVVTYNVHSCRGLDRRVVPERIAEVIAATRADVVCLQELDVGRARSGRVNQAEAIAKSLAMHFHFFPAIRMESEEYGDAILSRHPARLVQSGELPRTVGAIEPRGALWVEVECEKACWQVINTHLGLGRGERRTQARALAAWTRTAAQRPPVILCGDLNSRSGSLVHSLLAEGLREAQHAFRGVPQRTFATWFPWICLDYIYVSHDVRVLSVGVADTSLSRVASDHFPLVAELRVAGDSR